MHQDATSLSEPCDPSDIPSRLSEAECETRLRAAGWYWSHPDKTGRRCVSRRNGRRPGMYHSLADAVRELLPND